MALGWDTLAWRGSMPNPPKLNDYRPFTQMLIRALPHERISFMQITTPRQNAEILDMIEDGTISHGNARILLREIAELNIKTTIEKMWEDGRLAVYSNLSDRQITVDHPIVESAQSEGRIAE